MKPMWKWGIPALLVGGAVGLVLLARPIMAQQQQNVLAAKKVAAGPVLDGQVDAL